MSEIDKYISQLQHRIDRICDERDNAENEVMRLQRTIRWWFSLMDTGNESMKWLRAEMAKEIKLSYESNRAESAQKGTEESL